MASIGMTSKSVEKFNELRGELLFNVPVSNLSSAPSCKSTTRHNSSSLNFSEAIHKPEKKKKSIWNDSIFRMMITLSFTGVCGKLQEKFKRTKHPRKICFDSHHIFL